jgi:hypothetical protein
VRRGRFDGGQRHRSIGAAAGQRVGVQAELGRAAARRRAHLRARHGSRRSRRCRFGRRCGCAQRRGPGRFDRLGRRLGHGGRNRRPGRCPPSLSLGPHLREHRAHRQVDPERRQLGDLAFEKALDVDRPLVRLDHRDHVAAAHPVAGPDQPLDDLAGDHVGAERRHRELGHRRQPRFGTIERTAATTASTLGSAASSRCAA